MKYPKEADVRQLKKQILNGQSDMPLPLFVDGASFPLTIFLQNTEVWSLSSLAVPRLELLT